MDLSEIRRLRLLSQLVTLPVSGPPARVVAHFGAMQAQNYSMAKWAVGLRLADAVELAVEGAFQSGQILRTHVLRPTWHFVVPEDIRWLLKLTAPHVHRRNMRRYRELHLDPKVLANACAVFEKALADGSELTRNQLGERLAMAGIQAPGQRIAYMVMYAELEGVICSGARICNQSTYALLDLKAPAAGPFNRKAALAELAARYFASRGPATVHDFSYWSGLSMADARMGAASLGSPFLTAQVSGKAYVYREPAKRGLPAASDRDTFLMPDYDEYVIGYRNRDAITPVPGKYDLNAASHWLILDGQIRGEWRHADSREPDVAIEPFEVADDAAMKKLDAARERFQSFWRA